jgi:hypothetical protein
VLHRVPRSRVGSASLAREVLLGPAGTAVITVVGAGGTLASNTIVSREASASSTLAIASSLIRALSPGVSVVSIDNTANPGEIARAGALRAIGTGPLCLTIQTGEAFAIVVHLTRSVSRAVVLAKTTRAVTLLVPDRLIPQCLSSVSRGRGRSISSVY